MFVAKHETTKSKNIGLLSYCIGFNATFYAYAKDADVFADNNVKALVGMQPGQKKNVILPADKAFGRRQKYMLRVLSRAALPEQAEIRVGQRLKLNQQDGSTAIVTVTRVGKSEVTVDGNHPLAGQDIAFEIQLVTIN